jgi:hypothetical protein
LQVDDDVIMAMDLDTSPVVPDVLPTNSTGASSFTAADLRQEQQEQQQQPNAQQQDQQQQQELWEQQQQQQQQDQQPISRVVVRELSCCDVLSGGSVQQLRSTGSTIIAMEGLGSVTVIKAVQALPGAPVQLLPVGGDHSGLLALEALPVAPAEAALVEPPAQVAQQVDTLPSSAAGPSGSDGSSNRAVTQHQQGSAPHSAAAAALAAPRQPGNLRSAVLVACHPVGLMLLQRDLPAEAQYQAMARRAAEAARESGATGVAGALGQQPGALGLQQQQLTAAGQHLWLGAGEAAPWAAGVALPAQQHIPMLHPHAVRQAGAAGGGGGAAAQGLLPLGPQPAPHLLPSAACAPAPGTSVMCAARLGLHAQPLGPHPSSTRGSCVQGQMANDVSCTSGVSNWQPIWCLSATGGVSVAHMLQPHDLNVLVQLRRGLEQQQGARQQTCTLLQVGEQAHTGSCSRLLRRLEKLQLSAKYSCYHQDHGQWPDEDGEDEVTFPENCVDGDSLHDDVQFAGVLHHSNQDLLPGLLHMHMLGLQSL